MIEGIDRKMQRNAIDSVGYGYVVLPRNIDRRDYVQTALNKEKISIIPDQGSSFIHDCYITKSALRDIEFPETIDDLGSAVVYVSNHFNNKPFIIGVLCKEDESQLLREYGFLFTRLFRNNKVTLEANAQSGDIIINATNREDAASILLNCIGQTDTRITINCNGSFFASIDNQINISTRRDITLRSNNNDESLVTTVTINNNDVNILPQRRFNIGGGSEPVPKGMELLTQLNQTNTYLETLVNAISAALSTVDATAGSASSGPFNSAISSASPGDYGNVNSTISYTD